MNEIDSSSTLPHPLSSLDDFCLWSLDTTKSKFAIISYTESNGQSDDWHDRSIKIYRNDNRALRAEDQQDKRQESIHIDVGDKRKG